MTCVDCSTCTAECRLETFEQFRDEYSAINSFKYNPNIHSKPTNMLLGLTNRCNLNCSYCFVSQNEQDMSLEIAEQALQWLKSNNENNEELPTVGFFGGEPLLKFNDIIKPLVEKYSKEFNWSITTNGILLNEDIVDFLYKYDIIPLLSFDGVPEVQNKQRSNSFNTILKNIPYLLLRFPNITMRATVTKDSIPYLYDTVLMAEELGFKHIFFCENAFENWEKNLEPILLDQFNKIGLHIYKNLINNKPTIKVDPIQRIFKSLTLAQKNNLFFNNEILRCGLGTTSCAITPEGKIIPCQEKISTPNTILGDIQNGIDIQIHKNYLINYFNKVNNIKCDKGCNTKDRLICLSHLCPSRLEDLNYNISTATCMFSRMAIKVALRLHFLCANSSKINIRLYFEEEDVNE